MSSMTNFVVVGFPKCGTSALMRMLETLPSVVVERDRGKLEAGFYLTEDACIAYEKKRLVDGNLVYGHKHAAYIYQRSAIERIARRNPVAIFIVCIRDPLKALVSWREMHRQIAVTGSQPQHFTNTSAEKRRFFSEASLDEYYRTWVGDRLRYADHIRRVRSIIGDSRLVVIEQSVFARDPGRVKSALAEELHVPFIPDFTARGRDGHVGFADKILTVEIGTQLKTEIEDERASINSLLNDLIKSSNTLILN